MIETSVSSAPQWRRKQELAARGFEPGEKVLPVVDRWQVEVTPPELATVYDNVTLRCRRTGEGSVRARVGQESASAHLECFLAYHLGQSPPPPARVRLGGPPEPTGFLVSGSGGLIFDDVPVTVTSDAPEVLSVDGNELVAKRLGHARVTGSAPGPLESSVDFEVYRLVAYWQVVARSPISIELAPGRYELSLDTWPDKPLRVTWSNAPQCNYSDESAHHRVTCRLAVPSRAVIFPPVPVKDSLVDAIELVELEP